MNVGILGGTRFIGFYLARSLARSGHQVTLFNRGKTIPPQPLPSRIANVRGDRNNPEDLASFLQQSYNVVFDLSGYTADHIKPLIAENHRAKTSHYVFCSTSSVYKIPPPFGYTEAADRTNTPRTYGGEKALAEDLLLEAWHRHGWPVTILRPQAVFGPYGARQASYVFSRLRHAMPIVIGRDPGIRVSFLYVPDLITVFLRVANNPQCFGKLYNVAGDEAVDQITFVKLCSEVSRLAPDIRVLGEAGHSLGSLGLQWLSYDLVPDTSLIKADLQVEFIPLRTALQETWEWLRSEPGLLEPEFFRGEQFLLANRPVPLWAKAWWALDDLTKAWPSRRFFRALLTRVLKRSQTITGLWREVRRFLMRRHWFC